MEVCEAHSGITARIDNLDVSDEKQWAAIEKIQNRLPVWATIVISGLTFMCGCSMTYAALAVKVAGV